MNPKRKRQIHDLNDVLWDFTNSAQKELTYAAQAVDAGAGWEEVQRVAKKHSDHARQKWEEASALACELWESIEVSARLNDERRQKDTHVH